MLLNLSTSFFKTGILQLNLCKRSIVCQLAPASSHLQFATGWPWMTDVGRGFASDSPYGWLMCFASDNPYARVIDVFCIGQAIWLTDVFSHLYALDVDLSNSRSDYHKSFYVHTNILIWYQEYISPKLVNAGIYSLPLPFIAACQLCVIWFDITSGPIGIW